MKGKASDNPEGLLLSVDEAYGTLGISESLLYRLTYLGEIPSLKIGRRRLWPRAGLEEWISAQTAKGSKS